MWVAKQNLFDFICVDTVFRFYFFDILFLPNDFV